MQVEFERPGPVKPGGNRAFNAGTFGNAAYGGDVDADLRSIAPGHPQPANRDIALRHRVNLPVRAVQRGQDQCAAAQR